MISADLLAEAAGIVLGSRNTTHGTPERSFEAVAEMWTAYLASRVDPMAAVSPSDVAHMMVLLKMARAQHGTQIRDHWIDMAGYAALAGELSGVK